MAKKLLMLLNAYYPSDIRVKKESDALLNAGFEVYLLCLRRGKESYEETTDGINVFRIDAGTNNYQLAFWDVVMSLSFIHPKFKAKAREILASKGIDTIHVHDLPLAGTALALKKENRGIMVIVDFHENYPEALKTWFKWKKNPIARLKNKLFLNPTRWTKYEEVACRDADRLIAVVDEMKQRLHESYQIDKDKIIVVTNTEDKSFIHQALDHTVYDKIPMGFIITYSGGIGPHRGVDTAIKGMAFLKHLPIQLAIVGFGSSSVMNSLEDLVNNLQLSNVHFLGFKPFSKFYSFMHLADVNVIPHHSNGHTDNTVPHKLFQGMLANKPLLVSSCAPLKRYVEAYNCGVVFEAGNEEDFARKVESLYNDEKLRSQLAKNGFEASAQGELNWEATSLELIHLYESILLKE